ncbi:hypothetical protein ACMFMG_003815 [Clarireedia jacksonii]
MSTETAQTQIQSSQQARKQNGEQLDGYGSFIDGYHKSITAGSGNLCQKLCQTLLQTPQLLPYDTLLSDDKLFKKTLIRLRGENETDVIRELAQLIVLSAKILANRGAEHLEALRETVNKCWTNSCPFMNSSGLRPDSRPQLDFGLSFKSAFNRRCTLLSKMSMTYGFLENFKRICSVIDMLAADLNFDVSELGSQHGDP